MDGKNVLVTGANGHVGYALTKLLVERGYNVRASVRNKNDKEKNRTLLRHPKAKFKTKKTKTI